MSLRIGDTVPDIEIPATGGRTLKASDFRSQNLVLYFYPKASTPGCTQEGQDFRDAAEAFAAANTVILGASRDGLKAPESFRSKQGFPFDLLSDTDEALCQAFDVIRLKQMYGKQVRGIERSTFLVDADGVLRREWRGVKVAGHVAEVLEALSALGK
jgi:peroxiredoxin Q/BCP